MPKALDPRSRIAALRDSPHPGLTVRNAKDDPKVAEMYLYDVIGEGFFFGISPAEVVRQLRELDDAVEEIQLHVNSPGGDAFDGIAILNALRAHDARVVCTVDGLAASAASFIAVGSDEVIMARNSEMMVHDAWGFCIGSAGDMHDFGDVLDKLSDNIASIYAEDGSADTSTEQWREVMRAETWYSAQEAVDAGLADKVAPKKGSDDDGADNRFDLSIFTYAGRANAPTPPTPKSPAASAARSKRTHERRSAVSFTDEQMTAMRQQLGVAEDADEATILAALDEALEERADDDPASDDPPGAPTVPEGQVLVPEAAWKDTQAAAKAGAQAAEQLRVQAREQFLKANRGKYAPASRAAVSAAFDRDPEGTRTYYENAEVLFSETEAGYDADPSATTADVRETEAYKNWSFA